MIIKDLGLISYKDAEALQLETLQSVIDGERENTLYLLEHPKVITYGRQGGGENLHVPESYLAEQGIEAAQTARGGNITCHFPGQLVAYPIWRVEKRPGGMRAFFHDMEQAVIDTCAAFGIRCARREGHPGVWVDETRKICSMGIGVRKWVTYHGLALNVGSDVSLFNLITLCGIQGASPTSMSAEAGREISVEEVKNVFAEEFRKTFADSAVAQDQAAAGQ
ncbi:lipoyl(octanoyl) transferase LipB [Desulfovibrio oxyclinae]|jgi:lipoyl(octanoyl) transferase|uniref:lipoyl(octanoyl) transferase LipB n=1 Tax=Desulfovibrio oxyclinae TaxID=63560 RepID=UPI00037B22AA|nr:lipoyl(octanoyl) transferase LipB [Desulfovibrio oxyclinae]